MAKLWEDGLHGATDALADKFDSSIGVDSVMAQEDIEGSIAHARMLAKQGIISDEDVRCITSTLLDMAVDLKSGTLCIDMSEEDIHSFVEAELIRRCGEAGKRLHTARSRNDQVATDIRLYAGKRAKGIASGIKELCKALHIAAGKGIDVIMPGYTHMQRAQPVCAAEHFLAYVYMFLRDAQRLEDAVRRMNMCPLGSGALAGTTFQIDREYTSAALGFIKPVSNSMDGVSDRDFVLELLSVFSILMTHTSRLCEELVLWSSLEFGFVRLPDAYTTGSSIMPQKKNPDMAELIRGKTGRVYGSLMTMLTVMKGLPLAYNKDMQEDKEALFDAFNTVENCLTILRAMIEGMELNCGRMRMAASSGFINATDCADYLTKKGAEFRNAYRVTGDIVAYCQGHDKVLESMSLEEYRSFSALFDEDIYDAVKLENCLMRRNSQGGPGRESVTAQLGETFELINKI